MIFRCKYYIPSGNSTGQQIGLNRFELMCEAHGIEILKKVKMTRMLYMYRIRVDTEEQADAIRKFAMKDNGIEPASPGKAVMD